MGCTIKILMPLLMWYPLFNAMDNNSDSSDCFSSESDHTINTTALKKQFDELAQCGNRHAKDYNFYAYQICAQLTETQLLETDTPPIVDVRIVEELLLWLVEQGYSDAATTLHTLYPTVPLKRALENAAISKLAPVVQLFLEHQPDIDISDDDDTSFSTLYYSSDFSDSDCSDFDGPINVVFLQEQLHTLATCQRHTKDYDLLADPIWAHLHAQLPDTQHALDIDHQIVEGFLLWLIEKKFNDSEIIKKLMIIFPDIPLKRALENAAISKLADVIQLFLEHPDINISYALFWAPAVQDNEDVTALLLNAADNITKLKPYNENTISFTTRGPRSYRNDLSILHQAALRNHATLIKKLVTQKNMKVNARARMEEPALERRTVHEGCHFRFDDDKGSHNTPLHLAAYAGAAQAVQTLVDLQADVNAKNSNGDTPLHFAARRAKYGTTIHSFDFNRGVTIRHHHDYLSVVKILLDAKANKNIKNNRRKKPINVAHGDVVKRILLRSQ